MPRMSLRAAGREIGCDHTHLGRLVKAKRLARGEDGLIDLDEARTAYNSSDPAFRRKSAEKRGESPVSPKASHQLPVPPVTTKAEAADAVALIAEVLRSEGIAVDGPVDLQMARLADTILKARDRALRIDERRKKLVPLELTKAHFSDSFIAVRRAFQRMPSRHVPEMSARLGVEPALLQNELDKMIFIQLTELSTPVLRI